VRAVSALEFSELILENASFGRDQDTTPTRWGSFRIRRLPYFDTIPRTRLYSPDFISCVFGWHVLENEWDGLFCEVESPTKIMVNSYRMPLCLKWRSETEEALTKRSRGIGSLWTNAIKQIPPGEIGFIYIAYPEGGRPAIANARTRHILKTMEESWLLASLVRTHPRDRHQPVVPATDARRTPRPNRKCLARGRKGTGALVDLSALDRLHAPVRVTGLRCGWHLKESFTQLACYRRKSTTLMAVAAAWP
jgi:hypothetical protein